MRESAGYRRLPTAAVGRADMVEGSPAPASLLPPSQGLSSVEADALLAAHDGTLPSPGAGFSLGQLFLQCCVRGPMAVLAWLLALTLVALTQRWRSGVCLSVAAVATSGIACFAVWRLQTTAARAARAQLDQPTATAFRSGRWQQMPPSQLVPGDLVQLCAGGVVPADCTIDASLEVSEAMLTGESLPVAAECGAVLRAGSTVALGQARGTVQATGTNSFSGRLLRALRAPPQRGMDKCTALYGAVARVLFLSTTVVGTVAVLVAGCAAGSRAVALVTALDGVVLMAAASLPLGLEAAIATAVSVGAWRLARRDRVLTTRPAALFDLAAMDIVFVDKTGTLTTNALELQEDCHLFGREDTRASVLQLAALAMRWREPPMTPLDDMILRAADLTACDAFTQLEYQPFSPNTGRSEATVRAPDGAVFKVTKGMASAVLELAADRASRRDEVRAVLAALGHRGLRCIVVARTAAIEAERAPDWRLAGIITFLDPLRRDSAAALKRLETCGVVVKVISGDHPFITKEVVRRLGLGNASVVAMHDAFPHHTDAAAEADAAAAVDVLPSLADATLGENYAAVLRNVSAYADARPLHKLLAVEVARQCGHTVGFFGDGVNDAFALRHASVSIALADSADGSAAVGGGDVDGTAASEVQDAPQSLAAAVGAATALCAVQAADAVALTASLQRVVDAVLHARAAVCVAESVLAYRVCASVHLVLFLAVNPFISFEGEVRSSSSSDGGDVGTLASSLQLSPLLVCLHAACVALLTVVVALDRPSLVPPTSRPHQWNTAALLLSVLPVGLVGAFSSLLLQWMLSGCGVEGVRGAWCQHAIGASPSLPRDFAASALYLHMALSSTLAYLSCRARPTVWCWRAGRPSAVVTAALVITLSGVTALAAFMPSGDNEPRLWQWEALTNSEPNFAFATGLAYSPDRGVRLLPLGVWLWCAGFLLLQELTRRVVVVTMRRFNVLHIRETQDGTRPPQVSPKDSSAAWLGQGSAASAGSLSLGALEIVEHRLLS